MAEVLNITKTSLISNHSKNNKTNKVDKSNTFMVNFISIKQITKKIQTKNKNEL